MNQSVHSLIKGCLTLKLSLSWKMVICSSFSAAELPLPVPLGSMFWFASGSEVPLVPLAGEMGIVSRGTGSELFAEVAGASRVVDMVKVFFGEVPKTTVY